MKTLLFVDCCIRGDHSRTRKLGEKFLSKVPAQWKVQILELEAEGLNCLSGAFFQQREELLRMGELNHPRFRYAWQFAQADVVVFVAPLWDLSFPALLKVYIENVSVKGITFDTNKQGCYGICHAKDMIFLTTRGGFYEGTPMEMGSRYLEAMAKFFGIPNYTCIAAEGLDMPTTDVEKSMKDAFRKIEALTAEIFYKD